MIFKYNKYDLTEKNLYYLIMVAMLNVEIIVELIFVVGAVHLTYQQESIDAKTIIYAIIIISFGFIFFIPDALYRKVTLRKRIQKINNALDVDMFSALAGKKISKDLIYKDDEWFIAVPSPDCIVLNKNYITKDIEIKPKSRVIKVVIHTVDGDTITYMVEEKWKYMIDRLKKWMR